MTRRGRALSGAGMLLAAVLALGATASAHAATADLDDFEIDSFDADYTLSRADDRTARLEVVETIVAVFPEFDQNRGFFRDIPEYYGNVRLHTELLSVVDETGAPVPHSTEYFEDFFSIGLGDDSFVRGEQTYVIRYVQRNTIRYFADADVDEFQWDVNGTGWAQPFGRVSAEVRVAPDLVPEILGDAFCATGQWDEAGCSGEISRSDDEATGEAVFRVAAGPFGPGDNLTVAIPFAPGTFVEGPASTPPSSYDDDYGPYTPPPPTPWWLTALLTLVGPLGIVLGVIARFTHRRDQSAPTPPSDIIVAQYTPPDVNVMLAAHLAGKPGRAFAAQIVSLAVRKRIRLLDANTVGTPGTDSPGSGSLDYVAELVTADDCDPFELRLLAALFGTALAPGARFTLSSASPALSKAYDSLTSQIVAEIGSAGYASGHRMRPLSAALLAGGVATAATGVASFAAADQYSGSEGSILAVLAAAWGGFQTLSRVSTQRVLTQKGRELNDYLLGMREYLELAEKDRYAMLQSVTGAERARIDPDDPVQIVKLYERLLPWAVLWGVEKSWGEVLVAQSQRAAEPLGWVSSPDALTGWRLYSIVSSVNRATPRPPAPVRPASTGFSSGPGWSSSGGSSSRSFSSGGGHSGGGGGGGGGRGR